MTDLRAPQDFRVEILVRGGGDQVAVQLRGEVAEATSGAFADAIADALDSFGARQLVIDVEHVTGFDSTGLALLAAAYERCRRHGGSVTLYRPPALLRRELEATGMTPFFTVIDPP